MRLLFISQDFPPASGGIQTYAHEISRRVAPHCESVTVVVPYWRSSHGIDRSFPGRILRLPVPPDLLPLAAIPVVPVLARRWSIDVAFHAQWQTVAASLISRQLFGYPNKIIAAAHGRELKYNPNPLVTRLRPIVLRQIDHFTAVSRFTADLLESYGIPPSRISIVPNGTDPESFRPQDESTTRWSLGLEGKQVLLTVGRLVSHKGIDTTIQALATITETNPDAQYLVVGSGPDRERLERLVADLQLSNFVQFLGDAGPAELRRYYNACDVFVMASREEGPSVEGFGIVYLEANACGKAVIAGRSGGTTDAVVHGETGLLVSPDDPVELADAILQLLDNPSYRELLGAQGRARVLATANWDYVSRDILRILERVAG